ncbi:MAG: isoprenylcysteine carboxylmethyltransferase family protein [Chloroflexi bacterium]|nr:isoprenylcysteine carboxylmethyltransferase family protein [Chloroflexota bacterium]
MYIFLIPLLLGFALCGASAFTAAYTRRWGENAGQMFTAVLRNVLGIPLWSIGLALAWLTPGPLLLTRSTILQAPGLLLIGIALVPMIWGHLALGWRTHMPSMRDTLERRGPYAHVRHPIYAGGLLGFTGLALLRPTTGFLVACALGVGWLVVQARLEELDLVQRLPAYREYMRQVPGFVPRLWRRRS